MKTGTLSGKVALVAGGSCGIGAAIAKRLAADGAALAVTYTSAQSKADGVVSFIELAGGRALAIRRYAHGNEITGLVACLASPEAGFVTGAGLTIDGGCTA